MRAGLSGRWNIVASDAGRRIAWYVKCSKAIMNVFTLIHVLISLVGLAAGLVVLGGWLCGVSLRIWTTLFLMFTALTNVTGFFFPFRGVTPGIIVGILSLVLLGVAIYNLVSRRLQGRARKFYILTAHTSLYLNFFVLVAQLFQHTPALAVLAPHQMGPYFAATQGLVFLLFTILGIAAFRKFGAGAVSTDGGQQYRNV